jgi:hypothetical protein
MSFAELMSDKVELLKTNGEKIPSLKASVQGKRIYMDSRKGLRIEAGDLIIRKLSNGSEETYRVTDPGFFEASEGIEANYQMHVHKLSPEDAASAIASAGGDQISDDRRDRLFAQWEDYGPDAIKSDLVKGGFRIVGGPPASRKLAWAWVRMKEAERSEQARRSAGHTINVSGPNARVNLQSTDRSTNAVVSGNSVFNQLHQAVNDGVADEGERVRLNTLISEMEKAIDQKSFTAGYQAFITSAANHMTILTPMLPALTQLITSFGS